MRHARATIAVGLLVVVSIALTIFGVARSNRGVGSGDDTYKLRAMFDDVTGIANGTKVTIAGVTVGQVEHIQLVGQRVRVDLRLKRFVEAYSGVRDMTTGQLRNAAALTRLQASLLGDFYLELAPGAEGRKLKEGEEIPIVITATALQATLEKMEKAAEIVPKIDKIAEDVSKITDRAARVLGSDEGQARFEEIADNLVQASRDLSQTAENLRTRMATGVLAEGGDLDRGLRNFADLTGKANQLADKANGLLDRGGQSTLASLDNIEVITRQVRTLLGRNQQGVEQTVGSLADTVKRLDDVLARADRVLGHLETVAARVEKGEGNVGRLLKDETLVRKAEEVIGDAKALVGRYEQLEIGIDYRLAKYAERVQDPANLSWQSHLSLRFVPAKGKFVQATVSSDNLGKSSREERNVYTTGPGQPSVVKQTEVITEPTWTLGLQYGRRFGPVTLRGGLIESTAGAGLDVHLWHDRFTLSGDLFRFRDARLGDDVRPRLRLSLLWEFVPHVYAWLGGDELLYPDTKADVFFGAGLTFTDNDLKILFAAAPSVNAN